IVSQSGDHQFLHPRFAQRCDVFCRQAVRLFQSTAAGKQRMRENGALGFDDRNLAELHASFSPDAPANPRERNDPITSANTATAISAGLEAPIGSPIGAWMRAIPASEMP